MRKLFYSSMIVLVCAASSAMAQKLSASKVPASVKTAFAKSHPGMKVEWEIENGSYEAGFTQNGRESSEVYSATGRLLESEIEIKAADLPASVRSYVKSNYKGAVIKEAAKITKANGEINYEANVRGRDVIFDGKGKFLKESKD